MKAYLPDEPESVEESEESICYYQNPTWHRAKHIVIASAVIVLSDQVQSKKNRFQQNFGYNLTTMSFRKGPLGIDIDHQPMLPAG